MREATPEEYNAKPPPEGEPRQFTLVFGEKVARFFGYELQDKSKIILPGAQRISWAIDRLNKILTRDPIPIRFTKNWRVNFGITSPFWDLVFHTYRKPPKKVPKKLPKKLQ